MDESFRDLPELPVILLVEDILEGREGDDVLYAYVMGMNQIQEFRF